MKKQSILILCIAVVLAVVMAACAPLTSPEDESKPASGGAVSDGGMQVPNPITEYDTIEAAAAAAGFEVKVPTALPEGYTVSRIVVIAGTAGGGYQADPEDTSVSGVQVADATDVDVPGGTGAIGGSGGTKGDAIVEVTWANGEDTIVYRVAKETGADLSGDYTEYAENATITVGDWSVQTRGNEGKVNVATWSADGFDHALSINPGGEVSTVESIIGSLQ